MSEVAEIHRQMLDQSLKNINSLLEDEGNQGLIDLLKAAKIALEYVRERKGWAP